MYEIFRGRSPFSEHEIQLSVFQLFSRFDGPWKIVTFHGPKVIMC